MKKVKFINLVHDIFDFELFDKKGKPQRLPLKVRPETPGSEQWIRIESAEEAREFLPAPRWADANRLDELALFVHVSNSRFAHVNKYARIRDAVIEHYVNKDVWHRVLNKQDMKPSEAKKMGIFEIVYLVREILREEVEFDFNTGNIEYLPLILKSMKEYETYKVEELREECRTFKLSTIGSKKDLLNTLKKEIEGEASAIDIDLEDMSRDQLREECRRNSLSPAGSKEDLKTRLKKHLNL